MKEPLRPGEMCLLIDAKGRRYLVQLAEGASFSTHHGVFPHSLIIGAAEGSKLHGKASGEYIILRPRLADYILKMRRGAQVVYPKDIGPLLVYADIGPGQVVVEGGTGSGALAMALSRAVGPSGKVISVEKRSDHAATARKAIERWFGEVPDHLELREGNIEDVAGGVEADRLILDLPEPWHVIDKAAGEMSGGSIICAYVPTTLQLQTTVEALRRTCGDVTAFETLLRTWHVGGRSVRPDHRMVGHTGFLATGRVLRL